MRACINVLLGVLEIRDTIVLCSAGLELHETHCALIGLRASVTSRFPVHDCFH